MRPRPTRAWLNELNLHERLLVLLASAQSRYESALISRLRIWWTERDIRLALRELYARKMIDLDAMDRVRWRLTTLGMNAARAARERAQKRAAA